MGIEKIEKVITPTCLQISNTLEKLLIGTSLIYPIKWQNLHVLLTTSLLLQNRSISEEFITEFISNYLEHEGIRLDREN